jgi:hypothetical protein
MGEVTYEKHIIAKEGNLHVLKGIWRYQDQIWTESNYNQQRKEEELWKVEKINQK